MPPSGRSLREARVKVEKIGPLHNILEMGTVNLVVQDYSKSILSELLSSVKRFSFSRLGALTQQLAFRFLQIFLEKTRVFSVSGTEDMSDIPSRFTQDLRSNHL